MQYLVLSPPVVLPTEPPSGSFLLAAALTARGIDTRWMDLSSSFFARMFRTAPSGRGHPPVEGAMDYLRGSSGGYDPQLHRTASGILGSAIGRFSAAFPGWRLTMMDSVPPCDAHSPAELSRLLAGGGPDPFDGLWEEELDPVLDALRPERIVISLSYLSQLPGAVDLRLHLSGRGVEPLVGGSLPRSLAHSGYGLDLLAAAFPGLTLDDGSELVGCGEPVLSRLAWPEHATGGDLPAYLSARPVIPFALSTGCWWDRCLFCPDRGLPHTVPGDGTLGRFLSTIPGTVMERRPLLHFLDSAIPPAVLARLPGVLEGTGLSWYGFARPTAHLLRSTGLLEELAGSGCLMLQTGVESGSRRILDRFRKGLDPETALRVLRRAAEAGIRNYVYLLTGLPGEDVADLEATHRLVEEAGGAIDFLNASVFNLPWRSELVDRASEFGIDVGDFDAPGHAVRLYRPFTVDGANPRDRARLFLRERLPAVEAAAAAMARTPRWFRGAHMALTRLPGRRDPRPSPPPGPETPSLCPCGAGAL